MSNKPQPQIQLDPVKAAEDVVAASGAVVAGFQRSVVIEVDSQLSTPLTVVDTHHDSDCFQDPPAAVIGPNSFNLFSSRSSGVATGREGRVTYQFPDHKWSVSWANPFFGSNGTGPGGERA